MDSLDFSGLGVALITPYKADNTIDFESLEKIIEHIIGGGADYIVVLGTTGEASLLTAGERKAVKDYVRTKTAGRVPLVLGYGGNNTRELVEGLAEEDLNGFHAILSVAPFYVKPTQEGLYRHYQELASHSPLPVILYNVPGRTSCNLSAETTLRLAHDCPNIVAVKEASGNMSQIEEILNRKPDGFHVLSGDDGIALPLMALGASGVISVIGNAYPNDFSKMIHWCIDGNFEEARKIHHKYLDIIRLLFIDGNPAGIKSLMSHLGYGTSRVRLPLVEVSETTSERIHKEISKIG